MDYWGTTAPSSAFVFPTGQAVTGSNTITATSNNTSGNADANVQPTIICNYILRII
jgi:hypothetical protein